MSAKEAVIEFIRGLPDDATLPAIAEAFGERFGGPDEDDQGLTQEEWESAWVEEAERRLADARAGKTVGIPHEEVMRRMQEKYG